MKNKTEPQALDAICKNNFIRSTRYNTIQYKSFIVNHDAQYIEQIK